MSLPIGGVAFGEIGVDGLRVLPLLRFISGLAEFRF